MRLLQAGLTRLSLRASQAEEASVLTGREEATIQLSVPVRTLVCCPAPGAATPGLTSGAVSHRGQGKVPGCICVEGIDFYSERSLTR